MRTIDERYYWAGFAFLLLMFSWTRLADYDFWWHVNQGRLVWQQTAITTLDSFSYTFAGKRNFNAEWLSNLLFYAALQTGGYVGIELLKYGLLLLLFGLLYRVGCVLYEGEASWRAPVLCLALTLILCAMRFRLFVRPYLFSYVCVAFFLLALVSYRRSGATRWLWSLLPVMLLWANTSIGFYFGPPLVATFWLAGLCSGTRDRKLLWCLGGVTLVSLCNPETLRPYVMLFDFMGQGKGMASVGEHQPVSVGLLWGFGFSYTWAYQLVVLGCLWGLAFRRRWRSPLHLLVFVGFFLPSLALVRMIDFFAITAILLLPDVFAWLLPRLHAGLRSATPVAVGAVCLIGMPVGGILAAWSSDSYAFGSGVVENKIPRAAVELLRKEGITGRVFNSYPFGGYIPWVAPELTVYIDGRVNHLYPPEFHKRYFEVIHTPQVFDEEAAKWGFEVAVLEYSLTDGGRHFPRHLAENPAWALVWWDRHSALYLKRVPRLQPVIARYGYQLFRPAFNEFDYLAERLRQTAPGVLLQQAEHDIALNPANQEPRLALVYLLYSLNPGIYAERIAKELTTCLDLPPKLAMEHASLGMIRLVQGRRDEAVRQGKLALELDPRDEGGLYLKEKLAF